MCLVLCSRDEVDGSVVGCEDFPFVSERLEERLVVGFRSELDAEHELVAFCSDDGLQGYRIALYATLGRTR